jgi:tetratricopeptide (TPR) repeat protein
MYDKAIDECKKALKIKPDFPEAYNNLGYIYYETGKYSFAINEYKKAIELKPDYISAHNNLGIAYKKVGLLEKAKKESEIVKGIMKKNRKIR